ncbi:MAG TPA: energy-coupling factor transporter transmembrane component T [Actinomycetales bacterium]|nr:energy-coupling factor transporter transmembrane component T [Actinomycetales bacterium]
MDRPDLPRLLHPVAWWFWAVCLAAAASRTTNPLLLALIVAVAAFVVSSRREAGAPKVFVPFLLLGTFVIVLRVVAELLLGGAVGGRTVLFTLPELRLPEPLHRISFGGPVTLESLLAAAYDGARLAAVLCCIGAANSLASPRRLLRHVPATLYEVGTAVVVALTYAPQLVSDARKVRAARRLRGHSGRSPRELGRVAVPVMESALERALELAASMESRGYGRAVRRHGRGRTTALTLVGVGGVVVGAYGLLDGGSPPLLGVPVLAVGAIAALVALWTGASRDPRSRYRPDPWALPEWGVVASGLVAATVVILAANAGLPGMVPPTSPARFPELPWQAVLGVLTAMLAGFIAPKPPLRAQIEVRRAPRPSGAPA